MANKQRFIPIKENTKPKIMIIGGGVAGLTVAHELVMHAPDLEIVIVEKHPQMGGKARTHWDQVRAKFSEHSMRVLPGSYVCMHQIMQEIPHGNGTVIDRLTPVNIRLKHGTRECMIRGDYRTRFLGSLKYVWDVWRLIIFLLRTSVRIDDLTVFLGKITYLLFYPSRRVTEQLSRLKFSEYVGGEDGKPGRFAAIYRLAEILVAAKSHSSAGVVSNTLLEWFVTPFLAGKYVRNAISEFDSATSDALIEPWVRFLQTKGVRFEHQLVESIEASSGSVNAVRLADGTIWTADVFVLAVQHNLADVLIGDRLRKYLPDMANFPRLGEEWAHSVQFQIPELKGELAQLGSVSVAAMDSPWSIAYRVYSQATWNESWPGKPGSGILTATISNTKRPGKIHSLPFLRCTPDQILEEIVAQTGLEKVLDVDHADFGLDLHVMPEAEAANFERQGYAVSAIGPNDDRVYVTDAQMYIRLPGNLDIEPENATGVYNFFLAGEYTRTKYRIPTMEKSCESGKRCARAVIKALGQDNPRDVPTYAMPFNLLRNELLHLVLPWLFRLVVTGSLAWLLWRQFAG